MNIFENFIPNETNTCNEKDPPLMNKQVRAPTEEKGSLYKRLKQNMLNSRLFNKLDVWQVELQSFKPVTYRFYFIKSQSELILSTFDPKSTKYERNSGIILFLF